MDNQKWILAGVAALVLFQLASLFNIGGSNGVGTPFIEDYDPFTKTYGINTQKDITTTGTLTAVAGTFSGALTGVTATLSGLLTTDAGHLKSYTNSTSTTATAQTLKLSDVQDYSTVILVPNTASDTVTFFASSTAAAWLPAAGDSQTQCWINGTTTANIFLTFADGTGVDVQVASSSATATGSFKLGPQKKGCFEYTRANSTATTFDIIASFVSFL